MNKFTINQDMALKDALLQIEKNKHRSLIVLDDNNKVVGSLSDGDIRKALIQDTVMTIPISKIMNKDFIYVLSKNEIQDVNAFCDKKNIFLVPIIDSETRLLDVLVKD